LESIVIVVIYELQTFFLGLVHSVPFIFVMHLFDDSHVCKEILFFIGQILCAVIIPVWLRVFVHSTEW
jgi:hypothetical protein